MEELGVFDGKGHKRGRRQAKYSTRTEMLHMDAGYLAVYAFFNSIREKKKRENIAGGKFGPSLRPTELGCYS